MRRHQGGDHVKGGFYLNLDSWEISVISGKEGGNLEGTTSRSYLRIPVLAMLVFAPLMGALFAMFLPFIGIYMVAQYVATKSWAGARQLAHASVVALGPAWQPSAAHLSGSPDSRKRTEGDEAAGEADERLEALEREIDEQSRKPR